MELTLENDEPKLEAELCASQDVGSRNDDILPSAPRDEVVQSWGSASLAIGLRAHPPPRKNQAPV